MDKGYGLRGEEGPPASAPSSMEGLSGKGAARRLTERSCGRTSYQTKESTTTPLSNMAHIRQSRPDLTLNLS